MKKHDLKYSPGEIVAIVLVWAFALSAVYVVYLKMKTLFP